MRRFRVQSDAILVEIIFLLDNYSFAVGMRGLITNFVGSIFP